MAALHGQLAAFIEQAAGDVFEYGARDCCLFPSDWIVQQYGRDPAAPWRGRYHDELSCLRVLFLGGGVRRVMDRGCRQAGMVRVAEPVDGDMGVVRGVIDWHGRPVVGKVGALRYDGVWAVFSPTGMILAEARCLAAWGVR